MLSMMSRRSVDVDERKLLLKVEIYGTNSRQISTFLLARREKSVRLRHFIATIPDFGRKCRDIVQFFGIFDVKKLLLLERSQFITLATQLSQVLLSEKTTSAQKMSWN